MKYKVLTVILLVSKFSLLAQTDTMNLVKACQLFDSVKIEYYLKNTKMIDSTDEFGLSPLMYIIDNGSFYFSEALLKKGAKPNQSPSNGNPVLIQAIINNQPRIVDLLLQNGANLDIKDINGLPPVYLAVRLGYYEITDILLYYGANPNQTYKNTSPLMLAAYYNDTLLINLLGNANALINQKSDNGYTALMIASEKGNTDAVNALMPFKPEIDKSNNQNFTALALASYYGNNDIIKLLHTKNANLNYKIRYNLSPLSIARYQGNLSSVKLLKQLGAKSSVLPVFGGITISWDNMFNFSDIYTGGKLGILEARYHITFGVGVNTRWLYKRIWIQESEHVYYQYREKRTIAYTYIEKQIPLANGNLNHGFFVGYKYGLSKGTFKATTTKPKTLYLNIPELGYYRKNNFVGYSLSYQYINFQTLKCSPHLVSFSLQLIINTLKIPTSYWDKPTEE